MRSIIPVPDPAGRDVVALYCPVPHGLDDLPPDLLAQLSPAERAQAARFRFPVDRLCYGFAHALLRRSLHRATGRADWTFVAGPYGKPDFDAPVGSPPLRFNISHTRGMVACCLTRGADVGIDVEAQERTIDVLDLARHHFSPAEQRLMLGLLPDRRLASFYSIWTMKEAVIKASGLGLNMALDSFDVDITDPRVRFAPGAGEQDDHWRMDARSDEGFHLAVAVRAAAGEALPDRFVWQRLSPADLTAPAP